MRKRGFLGFFFQAEDGIRDSSVTGVQTCALPISLKERATPIVRSRPSSVHMDSVWFKRTLWETRNTALKNHAEAQFIIAGRREPGERSASYSLMQFIDHVVMTTCKSSINPRRLQYR